MFRNVFILTCLVFFFTFFLDSNLNAQKNIDELSVGSLYFLSGDTLAFKKVEIEKLFISGFQKRKINDNWFIKSYSADDLLYYKINSDKHYFYKYKPSEGGFLSKDEMEQYVLGQKDAIYRFKPKKIFFYSALFGLVMGLFDTSFDFYEKGSGWQFNRSSYKGVLGSDHGFITISTPLLSTFLIKQNKLKLLNRSIMEEEDVLEESYRHGYENIRHSKNTKSVTRGSLFGLGLVIAIKFIWFSDDN